MWEKVKQFVWRVAPLYGAFYVFAQIDVCLFVGVPETVKQCVGVFMLANAIAILCFSLPMMLSGRLGKCLIYCELLLIALIEFVELAAKISFDMQLNGDWILLALGTTVRELGECLSVCGIKVVLPSCFLFVLIALLGYWAIKRMVFPLAHRHALRLLISLALILPYLATVRLYRFMGNETTYLGGFGALHFVCDTVAKTHWYLAFDDVRKHDRAASHVRRVDPDVLQSNPVYVIGIGESLTRNHMSLYGYERKTTPQLDAMAENLIVYSDCIARYCETDKSVSHTYIHFNDKGLPDYTLPQAVRAAGYDCIRISMQISWSARSLVDGVLFYGVESFGDYLVEGTRYDDQVFSILERELKNRRNRPLVIFLHFRGNHFEYSLRYPKSETIWTDDCTDEIGTKKIVSLSKYNRYDNSVHYADKVMAKVIRMLEAAGRPSFFAFLADHGETPCAEYPRERTKRDTWEIPFFFWFSKEYRVRYPDLVAAVRERRTMPLQSTELFGGYLSLLHIEGGASLRILNRRKRGLLMVAISSMMRYQEGTEANGSIALAFAAVA